MTAVLANRVAGKNRTCAVGCVDWCEVHRKLRAGHFASLIKTVLDARWPGIEHGAENSTLLLLDDWLTPELATRLSSLGRVAIIGDSGGFD